jgi:hypothetical protein
MTTRLSRLIDKARALESTIAARVEGAARQLAQPAPRQPLEVVHAVLEAIEREVQPAGRGRRVFPFTHVRVLIRASSPRERAYFDVAIEGPPPLTERIAERLTAAGCPAARGVVSIAFVETAAPAWLAPEFHVTPPRSPAHLRPGSR